MNMYHGRTEEALPVLIKSDAKDAIRVKFQPLAISARFRAPSVKPALASKPILRTRAKQQRQ